MTNDHGRTAVYRCYDAAGVLLYIGSSNNPKFRYGEHSRNALKPWWSLVVRKDETWYDDRADAKAAEIEAVRAEAPLYNVRLQADAKTTIICLKVSEAEAALVDAARGELTRSAFGRAALLAAVSGEAPRPARPAPQRQRVAEPVSSSLPVLTEPAAEPCKHPKARVLKGQCRVCFEYVGKR